MPGRGRSERPAQLLFAVPALSLAGVPPLSGFFAKLFLIRAGLEAEAFAAVAVALAVGLLTLFSMTKIWTRHSGSPRRSRAHPPTGGCPGRPSRPAARSRPSR